VTDREDRFSEDDPRAGASRPSDRDRTAPEGVRIIGAEEAQAALQSGASQRRGGDSGPRFGDVPARPDPSLRPAVRFPRPPDEPLPDVEARQATLEKTPDDDDQPTWSASAERLAGDDIEVIEIDDESDEQSAQSEGEETEPTRPGDLLFGDPEDEPAQAGETLFGDSGTEPADTDEPEQRDAPEEDAVLAADEATTSAEAEVTAPQPLPHWTEPPTGEVPMILPEAEVEDLTGDEETSHAAATSTSGPRFRTGFGDWAEDDYEPIEELGDESTQVGAMSAPPEDDDDAFDREVAARRKIPTRRAANRPEHPPRPARSDEEAPSEHPDMLVRVLSGVAMGVVALICLRLGRGWTAALATLIVGVATFELYEGMQRRGFRPASILGILGAFAIVPIAYNRGEFAVPFVLALVCVFTLLWYLFEVVRARPVPNMAATIFGFVYVGVLGSFAGLMLIHSVGIDLVLGVVVPVIAYDVFGYLVGSQFGKRRLAPAISPNKTVEGLIGGMVAAFIAAVVILHLFSSPWKDLGNAFALGVTVAIVAPLGDLTESLIKRDLGIKDFGTLLPGHGGVLDRFDGMLLCLPAVYYLALALNIIHLPKL
jgi:phosphatidate cytidylyltransferase